mgnify:FL=1
MNNNEFYSHKRADTVKWIVAFALILVLLAGMVGAWVMLLKEEDTAVPAEPGQAAVIDGDGNAMDSGKTYPMPKAMSFTSTALAAALAEGEGVSVKITANVYPVDAANRAVDYSVAWGSAPTHGSEAVTDYVTVTPESDGSTAATVTCKQPFGTDKIIITVTTRDGGYTDTCTVSFVGVASTMSLTSSELTITPDGARGAHYQLGTNRTYTFQINLDNAFHEVGTKNLSVTVGGSGSLYFGTTYSDSMSGIARFQDMEKRPMSEMVDRFISSAILTGTTLTITTGSKVVENYYSSIENDEYMIGSYCYDRYVYEDEYGLTVGDTTSDNYEEKAAENTATLPSCYFTVTVTDSVSGLSETLRLWLVSSVSGVRFSESELSF